MHFTYFWLHISPFHWKGRVKTRDFFRILLLIPILADEACGVLDCAGECIYWYNSSGWSFSGEFYEILTRNTTRTWGCYGPPTKWWSWSNCPISSTVHRIVFPHTDYGPREDAGISGELSKIFSTWAVELVTCLPWYYGFCELSSMRTQRMMVNEANHCSSIASWIFTMKEKYNGWRK